MDFILETIMELFIEAGIETTGNKKAPKILRFLIMVLLLTFYLFLGSTLILVGIKVLKKNDRGGLFLIVIGVVLILFILFKFRSKIK